MAHVVDMNPTSWCWEHERPSLRHWMQTVHDDFYFDRSAVGMLYDLSMHSIHGYEEANSVVWKLVKKKADYEHIRNHSAFVKSCVDNAWRKLLHDLGYRLRVA